MMLVRPRDSSLRFKQQEPWTGQKAQAEITLTCKDINRQIKGDRTALVKTKEMKRQ